MVTGGYRGDRGLKGMTRVTGDTRGDKGLQRVTRGYKGVHAVRRG